MFLCKQSKFANLYLASGVWFAMLPTERELKVIIGTREEEANHPIWDIRLVRVSGGSEGT